MSTTTVPGVHCEQVFPLLGVADINEAVEYYTSKLGFKLEFTWGNPPQFGGVRMDDVSLHMSSSMPEEYVAFVYLVVSDVRELYAFHMANGVTIAEPLEDRDYGMCDYRIRDPWGNQLGFGYHNFKDGPPIEIERTELTVRLEKRLAALLNDLAVHKGMTLGSCLEETLLHSFEKTGDGVASPHTDNTLRFIEKLKARHGIDYDSHGSYRFKEK